MATPDLSLLKLRPFNVAENKYDSFFYLNKLDVPRSILLSSDIISIKLTFGRDFDRTHFSSLGAFSSQIPIGFIGTSPLVIQRLGLAENEEVMVSITRSKPVTVISVRPNSLEDYKILASIPNIMENIMLNQVRIVSPKQQLILKFGNIIIDLAVVNMKPSVECGRLEQYTEVVVLETSYDKEDDYESQLANLSNYSTLSDFVWKFYKWTTDMLNYGLATNKSMDTAKESFKSPKELLMTAFKQKRSKCIYYRVVLDNSANRNILYTNYGFKTDSTTPCKITKMPEMTTVSGNASKVPQTSFECYIKSKELSSANIPEIYLTNYLVKYLNLNVGSRVIIEEIPTLKKSQPIPHISDNKELDQHEEKMFTWKSLASNFSHVISNITVWQKYGIASNILIVGPSGCGKSSFLKMIANTAETKNIYSCHIDCKNLRGKKIENLIKILLCKFSECAYRDPSIILLDDLDALMYLNEEEGDNIMSSAYCKRVAELITSLYKSFQKNSKILLISTSSSILNLGSSLATSRGPRLFSLILTISELTSEERLEIFQFLNVNASTDFLNLTNGFRIQDLHDLMARTKLRLIIEDRKNISEDDLKAALEETVPISLRGVKLEADVPYKWDDVGGMHDIKTVLNEIFRWPSMHPEIFSSCPLKMQTGALLYGPPGCGKTLIAGALANECGMNFKSVKGPELLSKYVGASEAAVRDLFEKAQQARPCLVFFDELDSLAPRRGADSTGVTDRVVNQLLTELDGVEGRSGVWILGASSRPDLIDPALLRPGRLDRAVYCPVPSQEDRLRILQVLSKSLTLAEDVVFDDVIIKTEGFTGADLQALLYNAQMKAIQEIPDCIEDVRIVVTAKHLDGALTESKTSLSAMERRKYDQIFKRFQGVKDLQKSFMPQEPQRVTFA